MHVGDLVQHTVYRPPSPNRTGLILKSGTYGGQKVHTVRFFDGQSPNSNSFRERDLELISASR